MRPLGLTLGMIFGATSVVQAQYNVHYVTRSDYVNVPLRQAIGTNFRLGSGINMSDPLFPVGSPTPAFAIPIAVEAAASALQGTISNEDVIMNSTASYFEAQSDHHEAETMAAYFSASYRGLASGSTVYSRARERRKTHRAVYALIENTATGPALEADLTWRAAPVSEGASISDAHVLPMFLGLYGSHYIRSLTYGLRIAIRGEVLSDNEARVRSFAAAFKAKFGTSGGRGSITQQQEEMLRSESAELTAEVTAGSIVPAFSSVLSGYDQIAQFLDSLRNGAIRVTRAPLYANLASYFPTLTQYPRSQRALAPQQDLTVTAPFGVPSGTVIAWSPRSDQVVERGSGIEYVVPDGWAVCDGRMGTPDLRERFVMGTVAMDSVGANGGSDRHAHTANKTGSRFEVQSLIHGGTFATRHDDNRIAVDSTAVLPPYLRLVYIIKL